ncbi:IS110 family transposase [Roseibacillus ishigakijimensis]|nr:transposase [Roseibacillus ishigakijimensis]
MKANANSHQPSVYRNQNTLIRAIFHKASHPRKVLCVALDYAKQKHLALICDGNGDVLKAPFPVDNNSAGIAFLIEQITATAQRRKIPKDQIFLGGEDEASYVANFTAALRKEGYLVLRVNAYEAKESRENLLASTDSLDLLGIAKTLLARRAQNTSTSQTTNPVYAELRELNRTRRSLVRQKTAASNRIHALADQLFPGFLDLSKSSLTPFTNASLFLMKDRFSAPEIARRRPSALTKTLRTHLVHHPEETASQLITLAQKALPPQPHRTPSLQRSLTATVDLYQCLDRNAHELKIQAALTLATTPYALLTSIPGIGFVLASGLAGELGEPSQLRKLDSLCAYAGIVPRTHQSGGPDSAALQSHPSPRCNHILKDWTVQSSQKIQLYGPPELKDRIKQWNANGQHGIFAGARRYLRLVRTLVLNVIPYLSPEGRAQNPDSAQLAASAQQTWTVLQQKWRAIPGHRQLLLDEDHPIGAWRRVLKEVHGIHLPETL